MIKVICQTFSGKMTKTFQGKRDDVRKAAMAFIEICIMNDVEFEVVIL